MRTWVQGTKQILINMWDQHNAVEIAEQVNLWHQHNAKAKGNKRCPVTTDAGVMYQAAKLGYLSQDEAEAYHKQRKKLQARKNYMPQKVRAAVLERDGHQCLLCGASEDLVVNHIVSVTKGGPPRLIICKPCVGRAIEARRDTPLISDSPMRRNGVIIVAGITTRILLANKYNKKRPLMWQFGRLLY